MLRGAVIAGLVALLTSACGGDATRANSDADDSGREVPSIVVSTGLLGDVVGRMVGSEATVEVLVPTGADPHGFAASARDVAAMHEADAIVVNGGGFEEGLTDVIDGVRASGPTVCEAVDAVGAASATGGPTERATGRPADPHFFSDPYLMADAAAGLADCLVSAVEALGTATVRGSTDAYIAELREVGDEIAEVVGALTPERRVLVTDHDSFGPFARRYGFEIVGTVIPGNTTNDVASARELSRLAAVVDRAGVPAIFVDSTAPSDLVDVLAAEIGGVEVVELFSGSLGAEGSGAQTYVDYVRTNARRIVAALG